MLAQSCFELIQDYIQIFTLWGNDLPWHTKLGSDHLGGEKPQGKVESSKDVALGSIQYILYFERAADAGTTCLSAPCMSAYKKNPGHLGPGAEKRRISLAAKATSY